MFLANVGVSMRGLIFMFGYYVRYKAEFERSVPR